MLFYPMTFDVFQKPVLFGVLVLDSPQSESFVTASVVEGYDPQTVYIEAFTAIDMDILKLNCSGIGSMLQVLRISCHYQSRHSRYT